MMIALEVGVTIGLALGIPIVLGLVIVAVLPKAKAKLSGTITSGPFQGIKFEAMGGAALVLLLVIFSMILTFRYNPDPLEVLKLKSPWEVTIPLKFYNQADVEFVPGTELTNRRLITYSLPATDINRVGHVTELVVTGLHSLSLKDLPTIHVGFEGYESSAFSVDLWKRIYGDSSVQVKGRKITVEANAPMIVKPREITIATYNSTDALQVAARPVETSNR